MRHAPAMRAKPAVSKDAKPSTRAAGPLAGKALRRTITSSMGHQLLRLIQGFLNDKV